MNDYYIHPMALVDTDAIGPDTRVWAFTHISKEVHIGARCNIGEHCFVETGAFIGDGVTLKNGNHVWSGVTLHDGVFVGPGVCFTNDLHPRSPRLPEAAMRYAGNGWLSETTVRQGASIGAGAVILAGVVIGEFSMVGAGALVTRDVPAHALVVGGPARQVGWVCRCGSRCRFIAGRAICGTCGRRYTSTGPAVVLESRAAETVECCAAV